MLPTVLHILASRRERRSPGFVLLFDPDRADLEALARQAAAAERAGADACLVGGSLLTSSHQEAVLAQLKASCSLPRVLFPGSVTQLSPGADALFFLSLLSGRNPEFLIGQHVVAAPRLRELNLEVIPTGYLLIDCGRPTSASYISGTQPIPYDKPEIAASTALAGEYLGMKLLYLDGGSGAAQPIHPETIAAVREWTQLPLVVGGGIRDAMQAAAAWNAGADWVVVGTAFEENGSAELLEELAQTAALCAL